MFPWDVLDAQFQRVNCKNLALAALREIGCLERTLFIRDWTQEAFCVG